MGETPSKEGARLRGLDGIRALAVAAVVVFHFNSDVLPGGFLGVDVFFALSGYLITRLLLDEIGRTGHLSLRQFYLRRARRLLPAVATTIGVVGGMALIFWHDELPVLRGDITSSLAYVTNWWQIYAHQSYFVSTGRPSMLQHLWSLAIEEQFYVIWPLVLALVLGVVTLRKGSPRRDEVDAKRLAALAALAVVLAAASTLVMTALAISGDVPYRTDSNRIYLGTDSHSMGLLLGAAAAALVTLDAMRRKGRPRRSPRTLALTDLAGLGALVALAVMAKHVNEFSVDLYRGGFTLASGLAVVLVAATARRGSLLGWLLDRAPLRWLGERSYAIYLWHWPVAVVTRPGLDVHAPSWALYVLRIGLTLLLAAGSFALIERPARAEGLSGVLRAFGVGQQRQHPARRLLPVAIAAVLALVVVDVAASGATSRFTPAVALPAAALPQFQPQAEQEPLWLSPHPSLVTSTGLAGSTSPARPTPRPATPRPHATSVAAYAAFGDSVMVGAIPFLEAAFPGINIRAREGQQPWTTLTNVAQSRSAHDPGAIVIIHTGDNGIIPPSQLRSVLSSLSRAKRIFILNDRVPRDWQSPNNDTLHSIVRHYPNAVLLDWYHESGRHPGWLYPDGIHLRPSGATGYTTFVADNVRTNLA